MEKTVLTPSAPQFSRLEYALQLALKASTACITNAYIVSNPSWTLAFEKRTQVSHKPLLANSKCFSWNLQLIQFDNMIFIHVGYHDC